MNNLIKAINKTLNHLKMNNSHVFIKNNKHISNIGFSLNKEETTNKEYIGQLNKLKLENLFKKYPNILTAEFYHDKSINALIKPNNLLSLINNRVITEL